LELNVGKCKSITFSRLCHPVEFSNMLGGITLDHVDSIIDLGAVMDSRMTFFRHIDVTLLKQKHEKKQIQVQYRNGAKDVLFLESKMFYI
jgi:hypothetical protein